MEKQVIPNPICPKGCIYISDVASQDYRKIRLYVEDNKFYVITKLGYFYYWYDEKYEAVVFKEIGDNMLENFIFKSYHQLNHPIRVVI